jgi:NHLM bacteriocin system ABC transporter ATP-binding protein
MALLPDDLERALAEGSEVPLAANAPLHLEGAAGPALWLVEQGDAELFAVPRGEEGPRTHLASVAPGELFCGLVAGPAEPGGPAAGGLSLLAVGRAGTRLRPVSVAGLRALARDPASAAALAARLDAWLIALGGGLSRPAGPKLFAELRPAAGIRLAPGGAARTQEGVVWVRHEAGSSRLLGEAELALPQGDRRHFFPVPAGLWLIADGGDGGAETEIATLSTRDLLSADAEDAGDELWQGLARFHEACLRSVVLHNRKLAGQDRERLGRRLDLDRSRLRGAYAQLASILQPAEQAAVGEAADPLLAACLLVGQSQGIALRAPLDAPAGGKLEDRLAQICGASRVRSRRVILRGEWWRRDNGPMVAFREEGEAERKVKRPVALLPLSSRSYELADAADGSRVRVDAAVAESLSGDAHMFYPPLPERPVTPGDLLRSALIGRRGDVVTILLMGAGGGLLGMLVPLLTGQLFGTVLPAAQSGQLLQITLALLVAALAGAIFQLTRSLAVLRIGGKADGRLQSAVWDRLLSLPAAFFRRYTVGDLANRSLGINTIRETLTGNVLTLLLGAVFSVFSFGLLFYYSWRLALIATVLVLLLSGVTGGLVYLQIRHQRALLDLQGKIASLLFGLINGIAKLRVAGAEARAYARWADRFAEQRRRTLAAQRAANVQTAFNAVYGVLTSLVIFAVVGFASTDVMPTGEFLAFSAAFGQFLAAALSLVAALSSVLVILPVYERLSPILAEVPEVDASKAEPGDLAGEIEFSHVSFRYREDGPLILDDVSFRAAPGEFIALVGPSGAGKSTCLRLLLGFEKPTSGSIYFDGQDVAGLAAQSVRRQLGVVLQTGRPMAGSIFSNITGNSNLGIDDAWAAARMAGLEDDVKAMPMGMHTVVSEGAETFSGGQKQRILIARAIVNRPRIVLFDEATSALDNRTQEMVSRSLERLKATRIVIAHRLSTIENADRIYVVDAGRVVESGSYQELLASGGPFARLAERQIA